MKPCVVLAATLLAMAAAPPTWGATPRSKSLAQFDSGYAQCEKRDPAMRGHRDEVYASLYRLNWPRRARARPTRASAAALPRH